MATSTAAGAKSEGTPAKPRPLTRLLRYVLPYWWPFLASVVLMALVGLLDAGRLLLIRPIFDRVLNPGSQGRNLPLFKLPGSERFLTSSNWFRPTFTIHGQSWPLRWWQPRY